MLIGPVRVRLTQARVMGRRAEAATYSTSYIKASPAEEVAVTALAPAQNQYEIFYSPTSHKSMLKACESCLYYTPLKVNTVGNIDMAYLDTILSCHDDLKPLVCVEAANSEIGTIQEVISTGCIVHKHNGILAVDATAYIPSFQIDMKFWKNSVDILTFSGHKLHALKGIGVLWKQENIELKPLIYGSQQGGILVAQKMF